ncbi:cobyrinate a,c-diamide synthase [Desulfogranum marinum]|uniref:cobyrinate a,c-diamide synthase n=1 Tax=Desulfogranum marinum TaxID=453220 RepID=UPI001964AB38|nr:cobyrinate a,c-diamide synthase [Desulfogranum marinum]MBM9513808.1 cobyrinate a,c-diamide synthase [Desulfogranum marinum]
MKDHPAVLIAGTHSGCGKTTVTLGVMAALRKRGMQVQPFKCGPDFIDPTLHQMVTGRISRNLDARMCGPEFTQATYRRHAADGDCSVVEGVMGLFDGGDGSAAALATLLNLPVILVVDVRSAAESVAAIIKGFATLDENVRLAGVICNRVGSDKHRQMISDAVEQYCQVPIIGFLPRNEEISIPSRHLGLHMGEENPLQQGGMEQLIELIETHIDLDHLLMLAKQEDSTPTGKNQALFKPQNPTAPVRIGIARDSAFCFYYEDNLDMLAEAGAELVEFSPLTDNTLPENLQGLYLGGGYPELYAEQLSNNHTMRAAVKAFCSRGYPVYAECGGFMYLTRSITDKEGITLPMAGVFEFDTIMQPRLRRLGYRQPRLVKDSILALQDTVLHGHEFHYSAITNNTTTAGAYILDDGRAEGYTYKNTLAGYVHLHWGRTPQVAEHFVQTCRNLLTTHTSW